MTLRFTHMIGFCSKKIRFKVSLSVSLQRGTVWYCYTWAMMAMCWISALSALLGKCRVGGVWYTKCYIHLSSNLPIYIGWKRFIIFVWGFIWFGEYMCPFNNLAWWFILYLRYLVTAWVSRMIVQLQLLLPPTCPHHDCCLYESPHLINDHLPSDKLPWK